MQVTARGDKDWIAYIWICHAHVELLIEISTFTNDTLSVSYMLYNLKHNLYLSSNIKYILTFLMENPWQWETYTLNGVWLQMEDLAAIPKMAGMKPLWREQERGDMKGVGSNMTPLQSCTVMSTKGTNNELKETGVIWLIGISHIENTVSLTTTVIR